MELNCCGIEILPKVTLMLDECLRSVNSVLDHKTSAKHSLMHEIQTQTKFGASKNVVPHLGHSSYGGSTLEMLLQKS